LPRSRAENDKDTRSAGISSHQAVAAAQPHRSIRELAADQNSSKSIGSSSRGNFQDFDLLFDQLATVPAMELGKPAPDEKYLPKRAGSCHERHNRALFGEGQS
jgi:hypothetical protein